MSTRKDKGLVHISQLIPPHIIELGESWKMLLQRVVDAQANLDAELAKDESERDDNQLEILQAIVLYRRSLALQTEQEIKSALFGTFKALI